MSEELNKEETTEETTEETPETSEDTSTESSEDSPEASEETTVEDTVSKERFDGLMSARQRVETENEKLRAELANNKKTNSEDGDDKLIDYFDEKIQQRNSARETAKQEAVERELVNVRDLYPNLKREELLKTALKYGHNNKPLSLMSAAKILAETQSTSVAKAETAKAEEARKKAAGGISGRSGLSEDSGIKAYDPKKDAGKSISELIADGKRELADK